MKTQFTLFVVATLAVPAPAQKLALPEAAASCRTFSIGAAAASEAARSRERRFISIGPRVWFWSG